MNEVLVRIIVSCGKQSPFAPSTRNVTTELLIITYWGVMVLMFAFRKCFD